MGRELPADELAARRLAKERAIKEAKRRLKQQEPDDSDLSEKRLTNKLCMELADLIGGGVLGFKCHVYEDHDGVRRPLVEDDQRQVAFVDADKIIAPIFQHVRQKALFDSNYFWSMREVESCYAMWLKRAEVLRDIKPFDWLSGEGLTFRRIPFDLKIQESYVHPTWDKVLDNIESNRKAFMAYIGSIFEHDSYKQQYLWMYGSGGDGKGSTIEFLTSLMGDNHCVQVKPNIEHDFWTENLATARVAYFSDCKRYNLPDTGDFLALSGGSTIVINKKNQPKFAIKNNLKFIFASNQPPKISNLEKDRRRAIIVPFRRHGSREIIDPTAFRDALHAEGCAFISHCVAEYRAICGDKHSAIKVDADHLDGITSEGDEEKLAFIDAHFELHSQEVAQGFVGASVLSYAVPAIRLTAYMDKYYSADDAKKSELRTWIKHLPGVTYEKKQIKNLQTWFYIGIREKNPKAQLR